MPIPIKSPATQSKSIGPLKPPAPPAKAAIPPSVKLKQSFTGIRILAGGMSQSHTVEVSDRSADTSQFLPYLIHCNTCAFEGAFNDYDKAITTAKRHIGE